LLAGLQRTECFNLLHPHFKTKKVKKGNESKYRAIIYCSKVQVNGKQFLKYNSVDKEEKALGKFLAFAAKFPGAEYVNLYDKETSQFSQRIYLK
jgi:hypothetical protein